MILIETNNKPDHNWNDRLLGSKTGTIYQTKEIAMYHQHSLGWEPLFMKFTNSSGRIVGQLLIEIKPRFNKANTKQSILKLIPKIEQKIISWTYGPVIFENQYEKEIRNSLTRFLLNQRSKISGIDHPFSVGFLSKFEKPFTTQLWGTFLIDLSLDKQTLWNNLEKHSPRKNIERSEKRGVYIQKINETNLKFYYKLLKETKRKAGVDLSYSDTKIQWENLSKIGFGGFLAYKDQYPIGGILISFFNKYVNEWGVARSEKDYLEKLYCHDLIKWKLIEWGKDKGMSWYDLTGFNPKPKSKKEEGILRYKKKWGGQQYTCWFLKK